MKEGMLHWYLYHNALQRTKNRFQKKKTKNRRSNMHIYVAQHTPLEPYTLLTVNCDANCHAPQSETRTLGHSLSRT